MIWFNLIFHIGLSKYRTVIHVASFCSKIKFKKYTAHIALNQSQLTVELYESLTIFESVENPIASHLFPPPFTFLMMEKSTYSGL